MAYQSAEFKRNIWMFFSTHRVVMMLVIQALIYTIIEMTTKRPERVLEYLNTTAIAIFIVLTMLYGAKMVLDSVLDEMRDKTWDFQRMSSLSAFSLLIGKWFGSTAYAWFGASVALMVIIYSGLFKGDPVSEVTFQCLMLIIGALTIQAICLVGGLYQMGMNKFASRKQSSGAIIILGLLFFSPVLSAFDVEFLRTETFSYHGIPIEHKDDVLELVKQQQGNISHYTYDNKKNDTFMLSVRAKSKIETVEWYGNEFVRPVFSYLSLVAFLFWFFVGSLRLMQKELLYTLYPVAWMAFNLFLIFYVSGFIDFYDGRGFLKEILPKGIFVSYTFGFFVALVLTYVTMVFEPPSHLMLFTNWDYFKKKQYRRLIQNLPLYASSFVLLVLCSLLWLFPVDYGEDSGRWLIVSLLCFFIRDALVLSTISLNESRRNALFIVAYFCILYVLLPILFEDGIWLFVPNMMEPAYKSVLSPLVQIPFFFLLARRGYMKYQMLHKAQMKA